MTRIGPYTLHALETGTLALDGGAMFGIVPKPLWSRRIAPDERNRIPLSMRCLLLEGDGRLVLVDAGIGDKYDARFADLFAVDHSRHTLDASLAAAGFGRSDVTDVVLTHLHFDHCGGATRREGDRLVPAFENARYHVQREHLEWTRMPNAKEQASFLDENIEPLVASGQVVLAEGDGELFPGVSVRTVDGHTHAQQVVVVSDAARTLLYAADLLPTAAHLAPAWTMGYDIRPLTTIEEKGALLHEALEGGWHVMFEHDVATAVADLAPGRRGPEAVYGRPLAEL